MVIKTFINPEMQSNTYVITKDDETYIVDPGGISMKDAIEYIQNNNLNLVAILLTHGHVDHIIGVPDILKYKNVPIYIGEKDYSFLFEMNYSLTNWLNIYFNLDEYKKMGISEKPDIHILEEGDNIFGFEILNTPGHTHGSISYYLKEENKIFSGDVIFKNGYGRYDLPTGNYYELVASIKKIINLPKTVKIYSGHGGVTTVQEEETVISYFN